MKNKKSSLRTVLFLAISGFIALVYVASQHNGYQDPGYGAEITYGLDVELKWIATDEHADFAMVQDTLGYYASMVGLHSDAHSTRYRLDHCCDDPALRASIIGDWYHASFSADFEQPAQRQRLLARWMEQGWLRLSHASNGYGVIHGSASLSLPVPHRPGKLLKIQGSQFELTLAPRVVQPQESEPLT